MVKTQKRIQLEQSKERKRHREEALKFFNETASPQKKPQK